MRRIRAFVCALVGAMLLSACDFSVYALPLPGGADTGEDPIRVHVKFRDVLDLVPESTVKVADVTVGKVTDVRLDGYVADVTLELRNDVELPDNAVVTLRQTSLLGEKFVSLAPPASTPRGRLEDGDVIGLAQTGRNPEVEEVLGALSLVLSGGGVAQLKTITSELNTALDGREGSARSVLRQVDELMTQLDRNKLDIVHAIERVNRLARSIRKQTPAIDQALDELPAALDTINAQREDLVSMLQSIERLSGVGVRVIRASKAGTIESLEQLTPVLRQLSAAGDDLANSFSVFLTYPFVDETVGRDPQVARNLHMGDYTNLSVTLDLHVDGGDDPVLPTDLPTELPTDLTDLPVTPTAIVSDVIACIRSGDLTSKACRKVLADVEQLTQLVEECKKRKHRDKPVCEALNQLPTIIPTDGSTPLPSLPNLPGLPRAAFGAEGVPTVEPWGRRGPTLGDLMDHYDPALVSLLVPALVTRGGRR